MGVNYEMRNVEVEAVVSATCDVCGKTYYKDSLDAPPNEAFEYQEMVFIVAGGGYGSVFGDGNIIRLAICQYCLKDKLGEYIQIEEGDWGISG